jgi:hypothetical protein
MVPALCHQPEESVPDAVALRKRMMAEVMPQKVADYLTGGLLSHHPECDRL